MIRLIKVLVALMILRRLPLGGFFGGVARILVWAGMLALAGKAILRFLEKDESLSHSAWTEPPTSFEPPIRSNAGSDDELTAQTVRDVEQAIALALSEAEDDAESGRKADMQSDDEEAEAAAAVAAVEEAVQNALAGDGGRFPRWKKAQEGSKDCPDDYPVKAKVSSNIYHPPGFGNYDRTIPDVCFASEDDAELAGYRSSRR